MWALKTVAEAFDLFAQSAPDPDVWFCDRGLCVFKVPPPDKMPEAVRKRLEELSWAWEEKGYTFGDPCWYLFRSD